MGLILLIPASRFGGGLRYAGQLVVLVAVCVIASIWASNSSGLDTQIRVSGDVSARRQFQLLEQRPLHFAPVLLETFRQRGWSFLQSYVGLIGWLDQYLPAAFVISYLVILLLACVPGGNMPPPPSAGRVAAVVVPSVSLSFLIVALLSYLYWTPVGSSFVDGIHGRYLIPLSPATALLLVSTLRRFGVEFRTNPLFLNLVAASVSLISCSYFWALVWNRYYG